MGVITWIILGAVVGVAASWLTGRTETGKLIINIIVGVVGAAAGGFASNLVTRHPPLGLNASNFFVALLGTLVFLAVANAVQRG